MPTASLALYCVVTLLYAASTSYYTLFFARGGEDHLGRAGLARNLALGAHVIYLIVLGAQYGEIPLVGPANACSLLALTLGVVFTIQALRFKVGGTGPFILGLCTALQLISWSAVGLHPPQQEFLRNPVFGVHVFFALSGYAAFILSALYGVLYLILFRALKSMRFGLFFRNLPPLEFLARINLDAAVVGLVSLTLAIGLGLLLSVQIQQPVLHDAKFLSTLAGWAVYALLVAARYGLGLTGRPLVYLSLASFGLVVSGILVVSTIFKTFHNFA